MKTTLVAAALAACCITAQAGFIYHDSASTTGGEFSGSFPIGNLKNAGHDSHLDEEDGAAASESYATANGPTGGFPVTITLDFSGPVDLTDFYVWNHSNNGGAGAPANGVGDFTLTFFDGPAGGGTQIGAVFNGTAVAAPATGTYPAQAFDLGATYENVRSVEFVITDKANNTTSGFVALRELGFETAPTDFLYHDSASTDGGEFNGGFPLANLKNAGYTSPSATEDADVGAFNIGYATTNPPTGGYPVTITLEFDALASLEAFHLWNHSNAGSSGATNQGVKDFTLTFYDAPGGAGSQVGSPYVASAAKAPATGTYSAESFTFATTYDGVRSIVLTADNHNPSSSFVGIRELGFTGTTTPIPPVPPATPDKVIVYLSGGQSNADGYGVTGELSSGLQAPQPDIDFYHGNGGGNSPLTANQVIRLQPGSGSMGGNAGGFGPELNFGIGIHQKLGSELARIVVIKHTRGGTSLHTDWFPGGDATTTGDGPDYQAFQTTVTNGLAALAALYPAATIQLEGMIWHQGEADAGNATNAGNYQANLTSFIVDVRATYGSDLKFGIVQLSDNQTSLDATRRATVKAAQAAVAAADPTSYLVTTDDLPMGGGSTIHFGTTGNLAIGTRLAAGMRQVPITDDDGNGLDDNWEELYWGAGNTGQDPTGDDDQDGLSNLKEFLWLTNPLASNVIESQLQTSPNLTVSWPSSSDRRYLLRTSLDLESWQRFDSFIPGSIGSSTSYVLPPEFDGPSRYFQIEVHR